MNSIDHATLLSSWFSPPNWFSAPRETGFVAGILHSQLPPPAQQRSMTSEGFPRNHQDFRRVGNCGFPLDFEINSRNPKAVSEFLTQNLWLISLPLRETRFWPSILIYTVPLYTQYIFAHNTSSSRDTIKWFPHLSLMPKKKVSTAWRTTNNSHRMHFVV